MIYQVLDTIQGEKVKSVEELNIANFLYLNGLKYEYEKAYPHGDVPYRPDFLLVSYLSLNALSLTIKSLKMKSTKLAFS